MESKFKVGDNVLVSLPEDDLSKLPEIKELNGKIFPISKIVDMGESALYEVGGFIFYREYLEKVESSDVTLTEPTKGIDWEQRRWELVCRILAQESMSIADGIEYADAIIKQYKQTLK